MNGNEPICPCNVTTPDSERVRVYKTEWFNGLTKREWFAGMALSGILPCDPSEAAALAVRYADALLAALGKEGE